MKFAYAYLHGFASGPASFKGAHVHEEFLARGVPIKRLDLNAPSFSLLTFSQALRVIDRWYEPHTGQPARLMGSSMGGYLSARWAEMHPQTVDRMVLLCPGFNLLSRWPELIGEEDMMRWREEGSLDFEDGQGHEVPVHWGLIEDAQEHPPWPQVTCPTLVIHGREDQVVPIQSSRDWVAQHPNARLLEVDDDHKLTRSMDVIRRATSEFFNLPEHL